jgi:TatD DNase family protein
MQDRIVNLHTHHLSGQAQHTEIFNLNADDTLPDQFDGTFSVGIHPWTLQEKEVEEMWQRILIQTQNKLCVAIGECGIDRLKGPDTLFQQHLFIRHVKLAKQLNLPVIVHCVRAFDLLLPIISSYPEVKFIIHGYQNNLQIAKHLLKNRAYLSFGQALLRKGNPIIRVFAQMPSDRIFLENDYDNIPIELIFDAAAAIRQCSTETIINTIYNNFKRVFSR